MARHVRPMFDMSGQRRPQAGGGPLDGRVRHLLRRRRQRGFGFCVSFGSTQSLHESVYLDLAASLVGKAAEIEAKTRTEIGCKAVLPPY